VTCTYGKSRRSNCSNSRFLHWNDKRC